MCREPDPFQRSDDLIFPVDGLLPSFLWFGFDKAFEPREDSYGMFAVTGAGGTQFIQDGGFS